MGSRLYVGNLSFNTTEDSLRAALSEDGRNVKEVTIMTDRETGRPRGFAFAEMANDADAKSAIEALDGKDLDGRNLTVNEARERTPRSGGGGGGGGGRGGYGGGGGGGGRW
jgi:RNA recognition motif-containing protein